MRPIRILLVLAAVSLLAPAAALAGKGGGSLDGMRYFVDKVSFDKTTSLVNIDEDSGAFCLAARTVYIDTKSTLNRRVQFDYDSLGVIASLKPGKKAVGEFFSVDITLTVRAGANVNVASPILFGPSTVTSFCSLEASLINGGDMDKVALDCDLGPDLGAFGIPDFSMDPFGGEDISRDDILESIQYALSKKKGVKIKTSTGWMQIRHVGVPMPEGFVSTLVCDIEDEAEED